MMKLTHTTLRLQRSIAMLATAACLGFTAAAHAVDVGGLAGGRFLRGLADDAVGRHQVGRPGVQRQRRRVAFIVDEYGELEGLVTLTDVMTAIVGDLPSYDSRDEQDVVEREDGSWLVDGSVTIERLKSALDIEDELPGEEENTFNTLGGFVMHILGRIPAVADHFESQGLRFEVMDMDRNRVDKMLITRLPPIPDSAMAE